MTSRVPMDRGVPLEVQVKAIARAIVDRADELGLLWHLRPATVTKPGPGGQLRAVYDGDTTPIPMTSVIGRLSEGDRVMGLITPPSGNHVVGWLGTAKQVNKLPLTYAANWTPVVTEYRIVGGICFARIGVKRTGTALTASAAGNITDTLVATITDAKLRPAIEVVQTFVGSQTGGSVIAAEAGTITVVDMHSGSTIAINENVWISLQYPLR